MGGETHDDASEANCEDESKRFACEEGMVVHTVGFGDAAKVGSTLMDIFNTEAKRNRETQRILQ